jgi:hypothetical protein
VCAAKAVDVSVPRPTKGIDLAGGSVEIVPGLDDRERDVVRESGGDREIRVAGKRDPAKEEGLGSSMMS